MATLLADAIPLHRADHRGRSPASGRDCAPGPKPHVRGQPEPAPYADRLLAVALCQGAALHYLDGRTGVKDCDVWTFFARAPGRPHPGAALFRRRKVAGGGPSRFGRTSTAPSWVEGRRIHLFARSLDAPPSSDGAQAIRHWLSDRRTPSAARLSEKAVIEIDPVPGRVIWPPL